MQTDFSTALVSDSFLLGQQYDSSMSQVLSYTASEEIKFGQPVTIDFDKGTVAPLKDGGNFHGIALRTNYQVAGSDITTAPPTTVTNTIGSYPKGSMVSIMKTGRIVVGFDNTGATGTPATTGGSNVWYNTATNATLFAFGKIAIAATDPFATGTTVGKGVNIGYTVAPAVGGLAPIQITDGDGATLA